MINTFKINTRGEFDIRNANKNLIQILIFIPLIFTAISIVKYFVATKGGFIIAVMFGSYFLIIPMGVGLLLFRQNFKKVVRSFTISNDSIQIETNKIFIYNKTDIKSIRHTSQISIMSKNNRSGTILRFNDSKEFWVIEDYYNDYDVFKDSIDKNNAS